MKKKIRHASYTRSENETILVRCQLSDGTIGWGEGLARHYVTGETIETVWAQWLQTSWRSQLSDPVANWNELLARLQDLEIATLETVASPADHSRDCFGNTLRCAFELAILDAAGRYWGDSLSAIIEKLPETEGIRESQTEVRYGVAITSRSKKKQILNAFLYRLFGFQKAKVKVGTDGIDDELLLKTIRRWMGKQVELRIDANEAWQAEELLEKLEPLLKFQITSVEQPVSHAQAGKLAELKTQIPIRVMLDESLCSLSDAQLAIENNLCDLFNIRLSKCGGYINALKIAALAHRAGIGYQLGCMVGETGILSAAGRHFACSVANISSLEGSFDRFLVKERLTREDLTFGYGGKAPALAGPGLGVNVDQEAVQRVSVQQADWN